MIYLSKVDEEFKQASSNMISLLNIAKVSLTRKDFSQVRIPNAYLRGAILDHTNFEGADLTNVDLSRSFIKNTNFTESIMKDMKFSEQAYIDCFPEDDGYDGSIICLDYDRTGEKIVGCGANNAIRVWNTRTGE